MLGHKFEYRIFRLEIVHVYKNIFSYEITYNGKHVDYVSAHNDDEIMRYIDKVYF